MTRAARTFLGPLPHLLPSTTSTSSSEGGEEGGQEGNAPLTLPLPDRRALAAAVRMHAGLLLEGWAARHGVYIKGTKMLFEFLADEGLVFEVGGGERCMRACMHGGIGPGGPMLCADQPKTHKHMHSCRSLRAGSRR